MLTKPDDYRLDIIQHESERLESLSSRLNLRSQLLPMLIAIHLIAVLSARPLMYATRLFETILSATVIASVALTLFSLYLLTSFDRMRRRGDATFEELSDELQWHIRGHQKTVELGSERSASSTPNLEVRLAMRRFSAACDLPLVPGRFGPAIYAFINILLSLAAALLLIAR